MGDKQKTKPKRWSESDKAIRATQVAFDVENEIIDTIKTRACEKGVTPSDMIRLILGLEVTAKRIRPRLTMSLKENDYRELAKKYGMKSSERLAIKTKIIEEIRDFALGRGKQ
jgi:poly(A) polymerase Pap1